MHDKLDDDGDDGSDTQTGDLSANRFGLDLDGDDLGDHAAGRDGDVTELEAAADHYAEAVARYWGTPEGDWWP